MTTKRDELIEAARKWLEANTPLHWVITPEKGFPLEDLNRRPQMWAERMADFAAEVERETVLRVAAIYGDPPGCACNLCKYIDQLKAGS